MILDLYGGEQDQALEAQAALGRDEPPAPEPGVLAGTGRALVTALPAAGAEVARAGVNIFTANATLEQRAIEARLGVESPISLDEAFKQSQTSKDIGKFIKRLEPDPETSGTAAQLVHGFTKFAGKTVGYALTTGPLTPAMIALDEGINEGLRLGDQGVDAETAAKAGLVHGLATGAAVALPVAGRTVKQTLGLAAVGGPVAFSGEMTTIREILERADYDAVARQYDPWDITGLIASTAAPLTFGAAVHLARSRRAGMPGAAEDKERPPAPPKEVQDAAHVQQLVEADARAFLGEDPTSARAQAEHAAAVRKAEDRIEQPVEIKRDSIARVNVEGDRVTLQNRDRSTTTSVVQMSAIAGNPDYLRLSPSRNLAEGAPVVLNEASIPAEQFGFSDVAVDAQGERVNIRYAVIEADDLLPSHQADGVAIADYETGRAGAARVVAGNGRVAGLQAGFERGTTADYVQAMRADERAHGVNPEVIGRMRRPVLVRLMDPADVTPDIGDRTNVAGVADLSPVEQAANDAARVRLDALEFTEAGEPTPDTVRRFVQAMPPTEQPSMMDSAGRTSRQAEDRLMSAVFHAAYGDPELVNLYAAATDQEARNVINSLAAIAADAQRLTDAGELDLRPHLVEAAKMAVNARRRGTKLSDMVRQADMAVPEETMAVARIMADNMRSGARMTEQLRALTRAAVEEAGKDATDMFGDVPRRSLREIMGLDQAKPEPEVEAPGAVRARYEADAAKAGADEATARAIGEHFERAAADKPGFDAAVRAIADQLGGVGVMIAPLKGAARSLEKAQADYGGDVGRLADAVRATIVVDNLDQVQPAIEAAQAQFGELVKMRNTLTPDSNPLSSDGYRDVKFNVRLPSGQLAELQINLPKMIEAKEVAHGLYEQVRSIKAEADIQGRDMTAAENARIDELEAQMAERYGAAWAEATASRNAASESNVPLRRNESYGNGRGDLGSGASSNAQAVQLRDGLQETSTPSTSANLEPGGNASGSDISTSDSILRAQPIEGGDIVVGAAKEVALTSPDLEIELDDGVRMTAAEALALADEAVAKAETDSRAFEAAITCAMRTGE